MSTPENPYANTESPAVVIRYKTSPTILQTLNWIMEVGQFNERKLTLNTVLTFTEWAATELGRNRAIASFKSVGGGCHILQLDALKRNALHAGSTDKHSMSVVLQFSPEEYVRIQLLQTIFRLETEEAFFDFSILLFAWALSEACNRRTVAAWNLDKEDRNVPSLPAFQHAYAANRQYLSLHGGEPLTIEM